MSNKTTKQMTCTILEVNKHGISYFITDLVSQSTIIVTYTYLLVLVVKSVGNDSISKEDQLTDSINSFTICVVVLKPY